MTMKENAGTGVKKSLDYKKYLNSTWFYVGIYFVLTVVMFHQFLFGSGMLFSSDQMGGFDSKVFLKKSLSEYHQFPLWFSSRLSGMPSIDAIFGDVFYLPSILFQLIFPIDRAISMKMIFHIFLAGVSFFLLLRKGFRVSTLVAFTGGLFYMMNPQFFSHLYPGHDGKMFVIAWLPFLVWRIKVLMEKPSVFNASLLGFGVGMSILTSHIQMTYFVLWGLFFYWVVDFTVAAFVKKNIRQAVTLGGYFWGSIVLGLLMGCAQILPSFLYVREAFSVRGVERGFEFAASWALGWAEAFSVWVPDLVNTLDYYWGENPFKLNSEYAGAIPLLLAVLAIAFRPRKWRIFWGSMALFTILFALGAHTPVFHIAYYLVPGVKKFRAASMIMFWFSFSTILLSALFLKDMVNGKLAELTGNRKKQWTRNLMIANAVLLGVTLIFSNQSIVKGFFESVLIGNGKQNVFEAKFSRNFIPALWVWFLFASAVLWLVIWVMNGKLKAQAAVVVILLIGFIDMFRVDFFSNHGEAFVKVVDSRPYFADEPAIQKLRQEMKVEPFRCFTLPGTLPQNAEGIHGLEGVSGFHDNELRWYREFRGEQDRNYFTNILGFSENGQAYLKADNLENGNPFLDIANVKYLL
ncbi:MAG: YfhO family protein, partial [Fibrobacter sp.]|nr:YfhO family protein [Fibrobacter sp.]